MIIKPIDKEDIMDTSTSNVLNHHLTAFGEGSVEEILKDYTEDSVLLHSDNAIKSG